MSRGKWKKYENNVSPASTRPLVAEEVETPEKEVPLSDVPKIMDMRDEYWIFEIAPIFGSWLISVLHPFKIEDMRLYFDTKEQAKTYCIDFCNINSIKKNNIVYKGVHAL